MDPKPHQDLYLGNPAIYRMRCPHCQKLYSAERETMRAAQLPLNFHCVSCDQNFAASLNDLGGNEVVDTFEIRPEPAADPQIGGVRRAVEVAPLIEGVRCPKCGISNPRSATECVSCGVLFSKVKTQSEIEDDIVAGRRDLVEIWMKVMTNYEDLSMHERFVNACFDAENLTFASYKYGRILSASPMEEIANGMQKRILGLATYGVELSTVRPRAGLNLPGINSMILFMGGALLVVGFLLPGMKSLVAIGFSAVLLGLGIHFFVRHPSA